MTTLALAPAPAPALVQLERLDAALAEPDLDVPQLLAVHDRAVVVQSYIREANLSFDHWFDASVVRLRSERRIGLLLEQIIATSPAWESHAKDRRMRVPRGLLKQLGVSGSQSSRWRYIARLSDQDFESALCSARDARREITTTTLVRIARQLTDSPKHGGRPRLSTRVLLRRIATYMAQIKRIETAQERHLVRSILDISASWQQAVGRPDVLARKAACLACARERPAFGAPARCPCGGAWIVT